MSGKPLPAVQTVAPAADWQPDSWRGHPASQQPRYDDPVQLQRAMEQLAGLPPLVSSAEILGLKQQLAAAAAGRGFLLQGGDCAESFDDCRAPVVADRLKILLQMSLVLVHGLQMPVLRVGRFAGQYAKPRSADIETRDGVSLPSYRGDMVNGDAFDAASRRPDPARLVQAHAYSAMTLNFVRALIDGGFADLHHPEYWDLAWVRHSPLEAEYRRLVDNIGESIRFMETLVGDALPGLNRANFYTSHEALVLPYEQAATRQVPRQWGWFNLGTHYPWIGMRTADLEGAHVEYFRGIRNPIAVKVGPAMTAEQLLRLVDRLDPDNEPGRLTLIHRMGAGQISQCLPPLLQAIRRSGRQLLWCCDPMHGNTETVAGGIKTRRFDTIRSELELAFDLHAQAGTRLGGVHLELTADNVTECLGGARDLAEADLARAYRSRVDPRLNYEQALELAMLIVRKHRQDRQPTVA